MSSVVKALAEPTRRKVLEHLCEGPLSAGRIAERFVLSKPTMSGHLAVLREAGLVEVQRDGTTLTYRLNTSVLEDALSTLLGSFGFAIQAKGSGEIAALEGGVACSSKVTP